MNVLKNIETLEKEFVNLNNLNLNKLKETFSNLSSTEVGVVFDLLKDIDFYRFKIENLNLEENEIGKFLLINLALRNELKSENIEPKNLEVLVIKSLDALESRLKEKILTTYFLKGLHILKREEFYEKEYTEAKYKKFVLKYFHDIGGFQPGLWGIKINYDLYEKFIKEINEKILEKLESKNRILTRSEFIMLQTLFEK